MINVWRSQDHAKGILWNDAQSLLGPFHKAEVATVKMVFNACPDGLFLTIKPIEVNMVNPCSRTEICSLIFIHKGKGWTADHFVYTQGLAQCLDQGGFPCTKVTLESDNLIQPDMSSELVRYFR